MKRLALAAAALGMAAVLAPSGGSPAVSVRLSDPAPVGGETATTSTSAQYKFTAYIGSKPVRWNPCASIHWRFRTTNAPTGGFTVVKAAVARVAKATGINWVYDGTTTATPTTKWLPTTTTTVRPVLIGWTDGYHSDLLKGQPASVLAMTRTAYFSSTVNGVPMGATRAAVIALDRTNKLPLTGYVSWKTTMLHELGHLMGLDHVGNTREIMYPVLQRTHTDYQSGDLAGLYRLGRAAGCISLPF